MSEVAIARRFMGPPDSANGGFTCGVVAGALGPGVIQVTLRRPPPIERPLELARSAGRAQLLDGDVLVAEATEAAALDGERPAAISFERARQAAADLALEEYASQHPFPGCFTCGPHREPGDGLRIFPAAAGPRTVVSPWVPDPSLAGEDGPVAPTFVWAALDCPSGLAWYHDDASWQPYVLGRLRGIVHHRPQPGDHLVVAGWGAGEEGRKRHSGSIIWDDTGRVLAEGRATWIALDDRQQARFGTATGGGAGRDHRDAGTGTSA